MKIVSANGFISLVDLGRHEAISLAFKGQEKGEGCQEHIWCPQGSGPNTTAAFCASSDLLAIAAADNSLALYSVPSKKPFEAAEGWLAALYSRLSEMSGTISGISFLPDTQVGAKNVSTCGRYAGLHAANHCDCSHTSFWLSPKTRVPHCF